MTFKRNDRCPVCGGCDSGKPNCKGYRPDRGGIVCTVKDSDEPDNTSMKQPAWWHRSEPRDIPAAPMTPDTLKHEPKAQTYYGDPLDDFETFQNATTSPRFKGFTLKREDVFVSRDVDGNVVAVQARYQKPVDGGKDEKEPRPWTWDGTCWRMLKLDADPHGFGLEQLKQNPDREILMVEGPKTRREAMKKDWLAEYIVISPYGGCNTSTHPKLLAALQGRDVTMWPDNDKASINAFTEAAGMIEGGTVRIVDVASAGLPDKWDLADPIPEGVDLEALLDSAAPIRPDDDPPLEPRWRMSSLSEARQRKPIPWLIGNTFRQKGSILLCGESGAGKSFVALDMALAIATNTDWNGQPVEPGNVLYLTLEDGESGTQLRADAWLSARGVDTPEDTFRMIEDPLPLQDSESLHSFVTMVRESGFNPDLIVFDTFALSTPGIDENSSKDTGIVISNVKRIQRELNTAVMLVHHTRKENPRDYRGSSALKGAMDTVIFVVRDSSDKNSFTVECDKQRSAPPFDTIRGTREVTPGVIWDDTPMVAINWHQGTIKAAGTGKKLTHKQAIVLRAIERLTIEKQGATLAEIVRETGETKSSADYSKGALVRDGYVFYDSERGLWHTPINHDMDRNLPQKNERTDHTGTVRDSFPYALSIDLPQENERTDRTGIDNENPVRLELAYSVKKTESYGPYGTEESNPVPRRTDRTGCTVPLKGETVRPVRPLPTLDQVDDDEL